MLLRVFTCDFGYYPHIRRLPFAVFLLVVAFVAQGAEKLPKPDRIPADPTPEQAALVREGVALHDQGKFADAIAKYQQVLAQNPWQVNALYELSFSYFESKNYAAALETARQGAQCRSNLLPAFHTMIGSALDELGKPAEAIETYKSAIKLNPRDAMAHYNLAISLRRGGKRNEAREALQNALRCDPNHRSSHWVLASIYREMGYRVPAILAYSRFLTLEPESPRAAQALPLLMDLLTQGVGKGSGENNINIFLSTPPKGGKSEGDFMAVEMMMSAGLVTDLITVPEQIKKQPKNGFRKLVEIYTGMGEALDALKPKGGFAVKYYAPYFAALTKAGHAEAFVIQACLGGKIEGASEWASANAPKIEAFLAWSKEYQWPAK